MKKRVIKILIAIAIVIVVIVGLIFWSAFKELKEEDILKQEIINYANKDLLTDTYKIEVKTTGDRAYIEEAIKKYYKSLAENVQEIQAIVNDPEFQNVLSVESILKDRPNYLNGHKIINNTRKELEESIQEISKLCDEDTIKNLIDKDKLDNPKYYYDFYLDLMYTEKDLEYLKTAKEQMQQTATMLNTFFDKLEEILNFLEENDASMVYQDNAFYFTDENLQIRLLEYIEELEEITGMTAVEENEVDTTV